MPSITFVPSITSILASVGGVVGFLVAIFALLYQRTQTLNQREQTQIMAKQLEKDIEIKITRDLSDAPENDTEIRKMLDRRLSDVRRTLRGEYIPRLDVIPIWVGLLYFAHPAA